MTTEALSAEQLIALVQPVSDAVERIGEVLLVGSTCRRGEGSIEGTVKLAINIDARGEVNPTDAGQFAVVSRFHLSLTAEGDHAGLIVSIEAEFLIHYGTRAGFDVSQEQAQAYAKVNGVFNAWPYWREFVQSTSFRMGVPPPPIPVYRQGMTGLHGKMKVEAAQPLSTN